MTKDIEVVQLILDEVRSIRADMNAVLRGVTKNEASISNLWKVVIYILSPIILATVTGILLISNNLQ